MDLCFLNSSLEQRVLGQTIIKSVKVARIKIKSRANEMAFPVKVFDTTKPDRLELSSWGPHGRRREPVPANFSPPVLCVHGQAHIYKQIKKFEKHSLLLTIHMLAIEKKIKGKL